MQENLRQREQLIKTLMQYEKQENNNGITEVDSDKGDESMTPVTPKGINN